MTPDNALKYIGIPAIEAVAAAITPAITPVDALTTLSSIEDSAGAVTLCEMLAYSMNNSWSGGMRALGEETISTDRMAATVSVKLTHTRLVRRLKREPTFGELQIAFVRTEPRLSKLFRLKGEAGNWFAADWNVIEALAELLQDE